MTATEEKDLLRKLRLGVKTLNAANSVVSLLQRSRNNVNYVELEVAHKKAAEIARGLLNQMKLLEDQA